MLQPARIILLTTFLLFLFTGVFAQVPIDSVKSDTTRKPVLVEDLSGQYDVTMLLNSIFRPKKKADSTGKKSSGIIVIPNVASNPSIGSQIGIKAVAGRKLGNDPATLLSVAATSASITTKGIIYFYISHNIYTPGNKWNFQGNLVAAKTVTPDYGLGIGRPSDGSEEDQVLANGERKGRAFNAQFYNFREKVYKEVHKNLFLGLGVSFDIRRKIANKDTISSHAITPFSIYNERHGFHQDNYLANGIFLNVQYTTRDNQNRAYSGIYVDGGFRVNQSWMGSSRNALQFTTDLRKYFSLSHRNPEHVVALWNWGSYLLAGNVPYFELPGTAKDPGSRSGRGYTVGYFKGPHYNYSEVEYRFPILRNKFLSGVAFFNLQTADDEQGTKLFEVFQPGGGAGLRILFNKATRTNLCLDYAWGKFGARGFFLGLNEAF